jgi:hypothetical protein
MNTRALAFAGFLYLAAVSPGEAQDTTEVKEPVRPYAVASSPLVGPPHPTLFPESKLDAYDELEGSITVEDKAARVTYAPFLRTNPYDFWSEARLTLAQKDKITSVGASLKSNPLSPRSARGDRIWREEISTLGLYPLHLVERVRLLRKRQADAVASTALALAPLQVELRSATTSRDSVRIQEQMRAIATAALPRSVAREDSIRIADDTATKAVAAWETQKTNMYVRFRERLLDYRRPVPSVSYNMTLFPLIGGTRQDADKDSLNDNANIIRSHTLAGGLDFTTPNAYASFVLNYAWERASAEEGTGFARYPGIGITLAGVVASLNKSYRTTEDYQKTLFRPLVAAGLALETSTCTSDHTLCKDNVHRRTTLTPFVDFKIRREAQFRISFPFVRTATFDGDSNTEFTLGTTVAVQLGLPK